MRIGKSRARRVVALLCAAGWSGSALAGSVTATSSNLPTRDPITPGTYLPPDVASYLPVDVNPIGWASSQLAGTMNVGQAVGYVQDASGTNVQAAFWATATATIVNLHPLGGTFNTSHASAAGGTQIVGFGNKASGSHDHALLWNAGQGTNAVDLNPTGWLSSSSSYAKATNGFLQVGYGYANSSSQSHALMWAGSPGSYVDLNSASSFFASEALGISGNNIVGDAEFFDTGGVELHAMVWDATTHAVTDINPTSVTLSDSRAIAINGTQAIGYGSDPVTGASHALFWSSLSGSSVVDLTPRGYVDARATALNSTIEVGYGHATNDPNSLHALLWTGVAGSFLDLNQYLPATYENALAEGIDAKGNVVGYALNTTTGQYDAIVWTPVAMTPEPSVLAPLTLALMWSRRRKQRSS